MSSRHAAPRARRHGALVAATVCALLAVALGVHGTYAFWTDQATMSGGTITAGAVDIALDGKLVGSSNSGGTWSNTSLGLSAMVPGESQSSSFAVSNAGTAPLTYSVDATGSGTLSTALRFSVYVGGAATNSGSAATGSRLGRCDGTALVTGVTLSSVPTTVTAVRRSLPVGSSETVCLLVALDAGAANSLQGATGSAAFVFAARQAGG